MSTITSVNPATGETVESYTAHTPEQAATIVDLSHQAHESWRRVGYERRAELMQAAARQLAQRRDDLAQLMAVEMGKPLNQGRSEVDKCKWVCEYYAEHAESFLATEERDIDGNRGLVVHQPLGVVLAVMPWNFPFWQVFRFAAPALMAGNGGVLKHASNVPACALAIEEVFREAGLPEHIFRTLLIGGREVKAVIEHPLVRAVTLTGSTPAGKAVAENAGRVLKKCVLELGGSDPYIVLADADVELAVEKCVASRLINTGQSCVAAKRFIVCEDVYDAFEQRYVEAFSKKTWGDPLAGDFDLGPMARHDLRDELHEQVARSVALGAKCLVGGAIPDHRGAFYPATVLSRSPQGSPGYDEEMFGPVASILPAKDADDAVAIANGSIFGLGSAVFTRDLVEGERIASQLVEAGACFVNDFVKSDPRMPFGGIKESGYGRELSDHGIKEFVNVKSVVVPAA
ncbi:MAG TPA: NAD-dependent succinate-semialdehyde dehydrogenase [Thermoanaerobaculia bacterium]|nr:NAD-dependent succinate-semialdehyde dehydrogenase [Thermoanaerobaculia bacterium]